jgi:hypothetical protein
LRGSCRRLIGPHPENALCRLVLSHHHGWVGNAGCVHQPIITGSGRKAALNPAFKWVNTTLGNIKSAITGTYRAIRDKHVPRYLAEFEYRFNRRYGITRRPHDPSAGEEIAKEEVVKGYEYQRGQFVTFTAEELRALDVESSRVIDLEKFVQRGDLDPVYFNSAYYFYPDGPITVEALRVIGAAMADVGAARDRDGAVHVARRKRVTARGLTSSPFISYRDRYQDSLRERGLPRRWPPSRHRARPRRDRTAMIETVLKLTSNHGSINYKFYSAFYFNCIDLSHYKPVTQTGAGPVVLRNADVRPIHSLARSNDLGYRRHPFRLPCNVDHRHRAPFPQLPPQLNCHRI